MRGNCQTQNFITTQCGFSLGGPIIKAKPHFFTTLDRQDQSAPFFITNIKSDAGANALDISQAALDLVVTIGRAK